MKALKDLSKRIELKYDITPIFLNADRPILCIYFDTLPEAHAFCLEKLRYLLTPNLMADVLTGQPTVIIYKNTTKTR